MLEEQKTIKLYDYQQAAVDQIEGAISFGSTAIMVESPTGSGKSVIIAETARRMQEMGYDVVIMVNISALVEQIEEHLNIMKVDHSILWTQKEEKLDVKKGIQLTMAQTMHARIDKSVFNGRQFQVLIQDEAHKEWDTKRTKDIREHLKTTIRIGLSATPYDEVGKALKDVDDLIRTKSVKELTEEGFLCPIKYFVPRWSQEVDYDSIRLSGHDYSSEGIEELIGTKEYAQMVATSLAQIDKDKNKKTIVFANSIEHADTINEELRRAGFKSFSYHSKSDAASITQMESFKNNKPIKAKSMFEEDELEPMRVAVSVMKIAIGFDVKDIEIGVLCRPTKVRSLIVQQGGRVSRTAKGKEFGILLDLCGAVERHGFLDEPYSPPKSKIDAKKALQEKEINVINLVVENKEEPVEITKNKVEAKIQELKRDEEKIEHLTFKQLDALFKTTTNVRVLVKIAYEIYVRKYGGYYTEGTINWVTEPLQEMIDDFPEYEHRLLKTFKTRAKNIVKSQKKMAALHYFAKEDGWLREQPPYSYALNNQAEDTEKVKYEIEFENFEGMELEIPF